MMAKTLPVLARQELALMKVVWRLGDATVREVYEALLEERRVAYTTVMTMMNILESKGYLRKEPEGRAYRYRPAQPERRVMTALVRDFVDRVFDGAATPLLAHLVTDTKLSKPEREALRRIIDEVNDGRKA
jgi:BlaI family transcriptional regulator, penicillinase repressor